MLVIADKQSLNSTPHWRDAVEVQA